jgi:anti-sigma factor RsiW
MAWTCDLTEDQLLEAMEGTLGPAERAELDRHLAACANCASLERSVRQTITQLHQVEAVEPAPWLVLKIIARTSGTRPARRRRFAWLDAIAHPRFALGVVTVLVTFTILFQTVATGGAPSLSDMNPVHVYQQIDRRAHLVYARSVKFLSDLRVVYEIQSRFQPESQGGPSATPDKKTSDELQRLFYGRLESRDRPAAIVTQGDPHELRYPS